MKKHIKQKIAATLLSVMPTVVCYLVLLPVTIVSMEAGIDGGMADVLLYAASMAVSSAVMCAVLKKRTGKRFTDAFSVKDFDIVLFLLFMVFTWCAGEVSDGVVGGICSEYMAVRPHVSRGIAPSRILSAIIVAPIFEEITIRYLGTEFVEDYYPMPVICIANAIYFSVQHGYNVQGSLNVMLFGIVAAYVYMKTKNLVYLIPVHMLQNIMCMLYNNIMFLGNPICREKNGFRLLSPQWFLLNLFLACVCIFVYYKRYVKSEKRQAGFTNA